jgi:hypothetical protein
MTMTVIEMRTMETICSNLPRISSMLGRIANEMKRIADMHEAKKCCICGKPLNGYGNNPWPYVKDENARCCDECNAKVIAARIELSKKGE